MENNGIRPLKTDLRAPTWLLKDAAAFPGAVTDSPPVLGFLQTKHTSDLVKGLGKPALFHTCTR